VTHTHPQRVRVRLADRGRPGVHPARPAPRPRPLRHGTLQRTLVVALLAASCAVALLLTLQLLATLVAHNVNTAPTPPRSAVAPAVTPGPTSALTGWRFCLPTTAHCPAPDRT
jgi:hypothetical protein